MQPTDVQSTTVAAGKASPLGHYETRAGRRELQLVADGGVLRVIDHGASGDLLVEPAVEGPPQARALAADYLPRAELAGAPLIRHPWQPADAPFGPSEPGRNADRSLQGDEAELFEDHAERLLRAVRHTLKVPYHLAEEACAFAWMQLVRTQPDRASVFAWLRVVAVNEALRLMRREEPATELEDEPGEGPGTAAFQGVAEPADLQDTIAARAALALLGRLPERQRHLFARHVAGLSYDEIAAETGDSWRTVERQLRRARARLRELQAEGDEDSAAGP